MDAFGSVATVVSLFVLVAANIVAITVFAVTSNVNLRHLTKEFSEFRKVVTGKLDKIDDHLSDTDGRIRVLESWWRRMTDAGNG